MQGDTILVPKDEYDKLIVFKNKVMSNMIVTQNFKATGIYSEDVYYTTENDIIKNLSDKVSDLSYKLQNCELKTIKK